MEITLVLMNTIMTPRALRILNMFTIGKDTIIIQNESVPMYIEAHPICRRVVRVLNKLVGQGSVTLKVAQLRTEIAQMVKAS